MSSGYIPPINMQTSVATQDTGYLRQNQLGAKSGQSAKVSALPQDIPDNAQLKTMIDSALKLSQQNINLDRGAILNILA